MVALGSVKGLRLVSLPRGCCASMASSSSCSLCRSRCATLSMCSSWCGQAAGRRGQVPGNVVTERPGTTCGHYAQPSVPVTRQRGTTWSCRIWPGAKRYSLGQAFSACDWPSDLAGDGTPLGVVGSWPSDGRLSMGMGGRSVCGGDWSHRACCATVCACGRSCGLTK